MAVSNCVWPTFEYCFQCSCNIPHISSKQRSNPPDAWLMKNSISTGFKSEWVAINRKDHWMNFPSAVGYTQPPPALNHGRESKMRALSTQHLLGGGTWETIASSTCSTFVPWQKFLVMNPTQAPPEDAQDLLPLHLVWQRGQVDLIDDRDNDQIGIQCKIQICQGLGFNSLCRIHNQ